jgi:integrase
MVGYIFEPIRTQASAWESCRQGRVQEQLTSQAPLRVSCRARERLAISWATVPMVLGMGAPMANSLGLLTLVPPERIIRKRLLPRLGETEALKIKPSEIKGWLESVQDEEDLENSTVAKIRRVMHLVYSMAQADDLIPRTEEANPVVHVHIATTTGYEAILVTPQQGWIIICRMQAFERLLTLLVAVTGLRIGEVLALRWKHVDWDKFLIYVVSNFVRGEFGEPKSAASKRPVVLHSLILN